MNRIAAKLVAPQKFQFFEEPIPALKEREILIKTMAVGLCHSDVPAYLGQSGFGLNRHGYHCMGSSLPYPMGIGHEPVGEVIEVGPNVTRFSVGDYVTGCVDDAFATHLVIPEDGLIHKIPESFPDKMCLLGESMLCVTNIVQAAAPVFGDRVAIVGCGFMGLMVLNGLASRGLGDLIAIDLNPERLKLARQYGATCTINPSREDVEEAAYQRTMGRGFDVVIEITGSLKGLETAVSISRIAKLGTAFGQGKIIAPSVYAKAENWNPRLGYNLMFRSPIVHFVHPWYCPDYMDTLQKAIDGCVNGIYPIRELISHRIPFAEIDRAFAFLVHNPPEYLKGIVIF